MLKQGFQEDIEKVFEYIEKHAPRKTQNLLFSATIPSWVLDLSRKYLSSDRKFVDLIKDSEIKDLQDRRASGPQLPLLSSKLSHR
jgi:ATP-dependent RNA helicase DDX21